MKIRQGFVSNSSSSSFICVMPKKVFDVAIKNVDKTSKTIIEKFIKKIKVIAEREFIILKYSQSDGCSNVEMKDLPQDIQDEFDAPEEVRLHQWVDEFCEKIPEDLKIEDYDNH